MSDSPTVERRAYSPQEAADALGCSRQFVYKLIAEGKLARVKLGRKTLIRVEEVDRLLEEGTG